MTQNSMIRIVIYIIIATLFFIMYLINDAKAAPLKSKFYDFSDQLIDGEVKRPTALYMDTRQEVKFQRLLRLKRTFDRELQNTARLRVFK